jgi:hypothetical protein
MLDEVAAKVKAAIDGLDELEVVREAAQWDVFPAFSRGQLTYALVICVRVPGTADDFALHIGAPGLPPHASQEEVTFAVRRMWADLQREAGQIATRNNGHGTTPGGLVVP